MSTASRLMKNKSLLFSIAFILITLILAAVFNSVSAQSACSVTKGKDGTESGRYDVSASCFTNYGWAAPVQHATPGNLQTSAHFDYLSPYYPVNNNVTWDHGGVDFAGTVSQPYSNSTPVYAIGTGVVRHLVRDDDATNNLSRLHIEHTAANGAKFLAIYGHCYPQDNISVGSAVSKGQQIGTLRLAGSPMHLHFELNTILTTTSFGGVKAGTVNPLQHLIDNPGLLSQPVNIFISSVDISRFPRIDTYFSVTDADGAVIKGLTANHFKLTEQSELEAKAIEHNIDVTTVEMADNVALALVIDRSGSMSSTDMRNAKNAANTIVDNLSAEDRCAVISFAASVRVDQAFTGDKNALESAINALSSGGRTALYDAIYTSVELTSKEVGIPAVLAFTDGADNNSRHSADDVINLAKSKGIPVYTIGLGSVNENILKRIANETGGTYHYTPDSAQLEQIYQEIAASIQDLYLVTYRTHNTNFDGTKRTIEVTATVNQQSASDTITYTVSEPLRISLTDDTKELLKVQQPGDTPLTIAANIVSALGTIEAKLFYRVTGSGDAYSEVPMSKNGTVYNAVIPSSAVNAPGVDFYITATDGTLTVSSPETLPAQEPHQISVFPNEKPIIIHDPVETADVGADIVIRAQVIDDTDYVERVILRYRQSDKVLFQSVDMQWLSPMPGGFYEGVIPGSIFTAEGVDYYIVAEDNHGVKGYHGTDSEPHKIVGEPPDSPNLLLQYTIGDKEIPAGGFIDNDTVIFVVAADDHGNDLVKYQVELRSLDENNGNFLGAPTHESEFVESGTGVLITVEGLTAGYYHWQARAVNQAGFTSGWVNYKTDSSFHFAIGTEPIKYFEKTLEAKGYGLLPSLQPIFGRAIISYEWLGPRNGNTLYQINEIQLQAAGFVGFMTFKVYDSHTGADPKEIWSSSLRPIPKWDSWEVMEQTIIIPDGIEVYANDTMTVHIQGWEGSLLILSLNFIANQGLQGASIHGQKSANFIPDSTEEPGMQIMPSMGMDNWNLYFANMGSPAELYVSDSIGRQTGLIQGGIKEEIPNSLYHEDAKVIIIYSEEDTFFYEVNGTVDGVYSLALAQVSDDESIDMLFRFIDIPTTAASLHHYKVNWMDLTQDKIGVTIQKDSDGDGIFEETILTAPPRVPAKPQPEHGSHAVSLNSLLGWNGGSTDPADMIEYQIYFGTTQQPPLVKTVGPYTAEQAALTYSPGYYLSGNTQYYWQVKAIDEHGITSEGPVWSFTTTASVIPPTPDPGPTPDPDPEIVLGNIKGYGETDINDVTLLTRHVLKLSTLNEKQKKAADVNGDGKIDVRDITLIMLKVLGLIDKFPAE